MGTETTAVDAPPRTRVRLPLVLALLVLAPVCAEYIQAYDDSTGRPLALLGALVIFVPLYGAPAVLLRELARRFGLGWTGILALATGLGILQAGVIDQSLFNTSYRELDFWAAMIEPTWLEPPGLSANAALVFVAGHAIWSFGVPIALVEGIDPKAAHRPWLRWPGLLVVTLLYLAAAGLLIRDTAETETASIPQLAGSLTVVAVLALCAFTLGRRPRRAGSTARVPAPVLVLSAALVLGAGFNLQPATWTGTVVMLGLLAAAAIPVALLGRSAHWTGRHVAALASGALLARVGIGFLTDPIGDATAAQQLGHNVFFLAMALLLGLWTMTRRGHQDRRSVRNPSIGTGSSIASKSADQSAAL